MADGGAGGPALRFPTATGGAPYELATRLGGLEVVGVSLNAAATALAVPAARVACDLGRCTPLLAAQDTVLLSHCHADHSAGLVAWLSARSRGDGLSRSRVAVPAARRDALLAALRAWPDLDRVRRRCELGEVIVAAELGTTLALAAGWSARAIASHHTVPSLGWQLVGDGSERPTLVVTGDSTIAPFIAQPALLDAAAAVVDCSFVEPGHRFAARLSGHAHLADWLERLGELPCDELVLAHLPPGTTAARIAELVAGVVGGPTLVPWLASAALPPHR